MCALALTVVSTAAVAPAGATPCPIGGASLQIVLQPASGAAPSTADVSGSLATPSCAGDGHLAGSYDQILTCDPATPESCQVTIDGLQPGGWIQRIQVTDGEALGQQQGRTQLLLDRTAGSQTMTWPLYRSVHTVPSLDDAPNCQGCLRSALAEAETGKKPALVQFAPDVAGTIRLTTAPNPLAAGHVTVDGFDTDGVPLRRTIDGNGLSAAALRIVGGPYQILALRIVNVGGDSDALLVEGPEATGVRLDSVEVIGRAAQVCGTDGTGCIIDGVCRETSPQAPRGVCGDDGIAVRLLAGVGDPILIRHSSVSGAHDKGIKVSDGAMAVVEDSVVSSNADGGMQATLSGQLTARRNLVLANRGTTTANGLAANGAASASSPAAVLETRGNLSIGNALRGISVRSLSTVTLRDDFVCGNGTAARGNGFGLVVSDAAGSSAFADARGLAVVRNHDGGVVVTDNSSLSFGDAGAAGENAVAFNGVDTPSTPMNFRNQTSMPITAVGNLWQHCGTRGTCDNAAIQALDIFNASLQGPVAIAPALATRRRQAPTVTAIEPSMAAAGELVRIYGSGFDAIEGNGASCDTIATANTCRPLRGNCVLFDRTPADVVAVTPTMLVVRAPFTCVTPVAVQVRSHWAHGFGHGAFCTAPAAQ
jgi:hypothetical protein